MTSHSNVISYRNEQLSQEEFLQFKNEIFKLVSIHENKINIKIDKYKDERTTIDKNQENIIKHINEQYENFIKISSSINNRLDRLNTYEAFSQRTNDQLVSHEIRLTNISKDFTKAVQKYDKIYLDNLILPGYIGEFCKFKNAKEFFDDTIKQIGLLNAFKEKNIMDLKQYKERLETLIKNFSMQIDSSSKTNMKYANELKERTEKNMNEKVNEIKNNIIELKLENSKYATELKAKSIDLSKDWEKMRIIKEEIFSKFDERVNDMITSNNNTIHYFNEIKEDYGRIKRKFNELADFIKDIRFRKNIGDEITKREIKELVNKISFNRKSSFDKVNINNKEHIGSNNNTMRVSQSQEVESKIKKYIKGESSYMETYNMFTKHKKFTKMGKHINNNLNIMIKEDSNYQSEDDLILNSQYKVNKTNNNIMERTSQNLFSKKKNINPLIEDDIIRSNNDNINSYLNKTITSHSYHTITSNNNNYLNIFDLRKSQKDLHKQFYTYNKKVIELEMYTKRKLIELANYLDQKYQTSNPQSKIAYLLFDKEIKELSNYKNSIQRNSSPCMINKINLMNQVLIKENCPLKRQTYAVPLQNSNSNSNNNIISFGSSLKNLNKSLSRSSNRFKNGVPNSNRLNIMLTQTIENALQDDMKITKKGEKRQIINRDYNTHYNNVNTNSNIMKGSIKHNKSTNDIKYVPVKTVLTNQINSNHIINKEEQNDIF